MESASIHPPITHLEKYYDMNDDLMITTDDELTKRDRLDINDLTTEKQLGKNKACIEDTTF